MTTPIKPFQFCTRLHLTESTGIKASNLGQMVSLLKEISGSCIYHHTHRFLQQHEYLSPEPPNDFAYWVTEELGETELGERLASVDIVQFTTIRSLREKIIGVIEEYQAQNPSVCTKQAHSGREFYFTKSISFVVPTPYVAHTLEEFAYILTRITLNSVYFHIFEARLRLENKTNDFSNWIETSVGDRETAEAISRLDPYTYALDDLRKAVIAIIKRKAAA
jgi:hypothetical protein